jgi:hypothetical protein
MHYIARQQTFPFQKPAMILKAPRLAVGQFIYAVQPHAQSPFGISGYSKGMLVML